jgi:5-methylcytosine-specific restriction endonuclease McrA
MGSKKLVEDTLLVREKLSSDIGKLEGHEGKAKASSRRSTPEYRAKHREYERQRRARLKAENPELVKQRDKERYARDREKIRKNQYVSYHARIEEIRAADRAWYAEHREAIREAQNRRYHENIEHVRTLDRERYAKNPLPKKKKAAEWHAKNPGKAIAIRQNRRARKLGAEGRFTEADVQRIFQEQGGRCAYCKDLLTKGFHRDHKIPLIRGGTNWPSNIACACQRCNLRKHHLTEEEFRNRLAEEAKKKGRTT